MIYCMFICVYSFLVFTSFKYMSQCTYHVTRYRVLVPYGVQYNLHGDYRKRSPRSQVHLSRMDELQLRASRRNDRHPNLAQRKLSSSCWGSSTVTRSFLRSCLRRQVSIHDALHDTYKGPGDGGLVWEWLWVGDGCGLG